MTIHIGWNFIYALISTISFIISLVMLYFTYTLIRDKHNKRGIAFILLYGILALLISIFNYQMIK